LDKNVFASYRLGGNKAQRQTFPATRIYREFTWIHMGGGGGGGWGGGVGWLVFLDG